ncbi:MAG: Smr/MutS family protein [Chloroflexota bacterium]
MPKVKRQDGEFSPTPEIHLRHLTVDEALIKLNRELDDFFVSGFPKVRVVHGRGGTGIIRDTVRSVLSKHPLVKSFRPGMSGEGGAGATVVEFADK